MWLRARSSIGILSEPMPQLDFKEIPLANLADGEQDTFELFAREFLELFGFKDDWQIWKRILTIRVPGPEVKARLERLTP